MERPRKGRVAVCAVVGGLFAAFVYAALPLHQVPLALIARVHGSHVDRIDVLGGTRLVYRVIEGDAGEAARSLASRTGHPVAVEHGQLVVDLPGVLPDEAARVTDALLADGRFEIKRVADGRPLMKGLLAEVDEDPEAPVRGEYDIWEDPATGEIHRDDFLFAPSREALEDYLAARAMEADPEFEIAIGRLEPYAEPALAPDLERGVRTFYLRADAEITSADVQRTEIVRHPITSLPEVLLHLDEPGKRRLARLSREHAGRKIALLVGGRVLRAPIVAEELTDGRVMLGTGTAAPAAGRIAARALASAVAGDAPLPARLELVRSTGRDPVVSRNAPRAAGAVFAALAGLGSALLLLLVGLVTPRPEPPVERQPNAARWKVWPRLAVTLLAIPVVWLVAEIGLPGVNSVRLHVAAFWISPVFAAFVLVELAALAVPRWRTLRTAGPAGRARLGRAVAVVLVLLALAQGWFATSFLLGLPMAGDLIHDPGLLWRALVMLTICGGALFYVVYAWRLGRSGLGNGYSILILALFAVHSGLFAGTSLVLGVPAYAGPASELSLAVADGHVTPLQLLAAGAGVLLTCAATWWILRIRVPGSGALSLRLPTCGLIPMVLLSILVSPVVLSSFEMTAPLELGSASLGATLAFALLLSLLFAGVLSWLFSRPRQLSDAARLVSGGSNELERGFRTALALSAGYIALLAALAAALSRLDPALFFVPAPAALLTSIVLDLAAEWRARRLRSDLVPLWPIHRVQVVDLAVSSLRSADIDVFPRGLHLRTMLFFFGPFVPVMLMVPEPDAGRARELLESLFETPAHADREPTTS